jgi:3',5'-cyclic AMP phosphodiesterase CpdA
MNEDAELGSRVVRLLHFSDIHVGIRLRDMPLGAWLGKRAMGGLNLLAGRGKYFAAAREKMEKLAGFARDNDVDLTVFTGDYTALGLAQEYSAARTAVEPLMKAPLGFVNVPGNHDLYVPDIVSDRRFERHFGDTLESDLPGCQVDGAWPLVRLVGEDVGIIAVNSSRPNPLWRSSGKIPRGQLDALGRLLGDDRLKERYLFVTTHYAPRLGDGRSDSRLHGLTNAEEFLAVCADIRYGTILCGHVHECFHVQVPGVRPAVFCAGSATLAGKEGLWLFDLYGTKVRATQGRWNGGCYELDADSTVEA